MADRRQFLVASALAIAGATRARAAQSPAKTFRIGHLSGSGEAGSKTNTDAFKQGMRELGYIEGENWIFEQRFAGGQTDRLPALAQELIRRGKVTVDGRIVTDAERTVVPETAAIGLNIRSPDHPIARSPDH